MTLKRNYFCVFLIIVLSSCSSIEKKVTTIPEENLKKNIVLLQNPASKNIMVAAHRGDWRNFPENSIPALLSSIKMGVDIMELDLNRTKDGHLIVLHDKTLDRSTTGKGKPQDYTLEEVKKFRLRNGMGRATKHLIPTFKEMLLIAKGKILVDVDKGYEYFPQVIKELKETGTLDQAIINIITENPYYSDVIKKHGHFDEDVFIMPILDLEKQNIQEIIESYSVHKNTILQPVFEVDSYPLISTFPVLKNNNGIWINSLWASLNGGHDDEIAVEDNKKEESWGWITKQGATIIQTDNPKELLEYLREKKLHN
ncbi:glycerophosphodiester phosphodiesterase family protein [Flavobacterium sp. LAR06]|uniref:glycerophosphodiester phosphodiesterase family protein n=1 Tax=Flavobacterium sp. LAR06 TaxID=3064897 RepID=UPI0035C12B39